MKITEQFNHEAEHTYDAMHVDPEKMEYIFKALSNLVKIKELTQSEVYEKIIELCNTPEELVMAISKVEVLKAKYLMKDFLEQHKETTILSLFIDEIFSKQ